MVSVGTLFQAALLPGIMLALLYALYAFGYALLNPDKAPAVEMAGGSKRGHNTFGRLDMAAGCSSCPDCWCGADEQRGCDR